MTFQRLTASVVGVSLYHPACWNSVLMNQLIRMRAAIGWAAPATGVIVWRSAVMPETG